MNKLPNDPSSATRPTKPQSCNETAMPGSPERMVRRLTSGHTLLSLAFEPSQSLESLLQYDGLKPHVSSKVLDAYQAYVREVIPELELVYRKRALVLEKSLCRIFADEYKIGKSPNESSSATAGTKL